MQSSAQPNSIMPNSPPYNATIGTVIDERRRKQSFFKHGIHVKPADHCRHNIATAW